MTIRLFLRSVAAVLALAALSGPAAANGAIEARYKAPHALVGSWRVTITPYHCATLVEFPQFAFESMLTFNLGGTLTETTANANFAPGQRSAGFGQWERTGPNAYRATFEAFVQFTLPAPPPPPAPNYQRGRQVLKQTLEMTDSNRWISVATVEFFDFAGAPTRPLGCATAVGTRIVH